MALPSPSRRGPLPRSAGKPEEPPQGLAEEGTLAQQLQAIAMQLWSFAAERPAPDDAALTCGVAPLDQRKVLIALVEQEYEQRRAREGLFNRALFGEPAWDMLLYLFAAQLRGDLVATSSLVRASVVPATTALRWIAQLEQASLIERCTIERDGRVRIQRLTRRATALLEQYFWRRTATVGTFCAPPAGEPPVASSEPVPICLPGQRAAPKRARRSATRAKRSKHGGSAATCEE